ncbi:hypothetical protein OK074_4301 [Actinobacteria bacterium OK074]|nr:hypothetical protein OK074_4301 [Actinobacteria bacterium OK074]
MSASVSLAMTHLVTLADVDEDKVTPGVLGFIVFAALAVAVWGLMKSMSKHMNKVDFKVEGDGDAAGAAGASGKGGTKAAASARAEQTAEAAQGPKAAQSPGGGKGGKGKTAPPSPAKG